MDFCDCRQPFGYQPTIFRMVGLWCSRRIVEVGMKKLIFVTLLLSSPAVAQDDSQLGAQPKCEPIGRTSKGDLVYSMECRNIPGLAAGTNGYNPVPPSIVKTVPVKPDPVPNTK
jgi:hypothetical protein